MSVVIFIYLNGECEQFSYSGSDDFEYWMGKRQYKWHDIESVYVSSHAINFQDFIDRKEQEQNKYEEEIRLKQERETYLQLKAKYEGPNETQT